MIEDIRVRLLSFPFCVVCHVGRQANIDAHTLAKYTLSLNANLVGWRSIRPPSIFHFVTAEKLTSAN
jgi:hypothetical protein